MQTYFLLSDINLPVKFWIGGLEGFDPLVAAGGCNFEADIFVQVEVWAASHPLGISVSTSMRTFTSPDIQFNEWLTLPVKYRDLPPTSRIAVTIYLTRHTLTESGVSSSMCPVGGSCMPFFNQRGLLKTGLRKMRVWPGVEADGCIDTRTPYRCGPLSKPVERQIKKHVRAWEERALPAVGWLDRVGTKLVDRLEATKAPYDGADEGQLLLRVHLPSFGHRVVFHEKTCNPPLSEILPITDRDRLQILHDPEVRRENPIELYMHKRNRSLKRVNRDLRPKVYERKQLESIINSPDKRLTGERRELVWKFRYVLTENKRALTKFLRCIDWADEKEVKEAVDLMHAWTPVDIADALELLSPYFQNADVRSYAVRQLARADNEEIGSFLLQLVQALRYEPAHPSPLSAFLIARSTQSLQLANFLHWYLMVEKQDKTKGDMFADVHHHFLDALRKTPDGEEWISVLEGEEQLIKQLIAIGNWANAKGGKVDKKVERLRAGLSATGEFRALRKFDRPVHIAVKPEIVVTGMIGEKSTMFTSKLAPLCICFSTIDGKEYRTIFKAGDDLRQDQLVLQMFNLMDSLLKKVKLDLQLTPYKVLATGPEEGFVEFVPGSYNVSHVLEKFDKDIRKFLQHYNPKPAAQQKALETFVRSAAGYCVITYILGIGDRHLDNLLMRTDGHLFHIDFGFAFGRDPKPLPPPMKFCKEMVEAMGGSHSLQYLDFKKYVALAFSILRQHANLILNLLSLMVDANIPDLSSDAEKNLLKVQEKFRLDLTDEEADQYILALIDESVTALFPQLCEKIHQWAMYWK